MPAGAACHSVVGIESKPIVEDQMPTYIIEREIPGASQLNEAELQGITTKSNDVVAGLNRPYTWRHSYVAGDKIYCVHDAESAEDVLEHARCGGFPANLVAEVAAVFDSTGPRDLPA
jgi:Protein of unknown function (DUF4242)